MSGYWNSYGPSPPIGPCDYCQNYGHWSDQCNVAPYYPPPPYNASDYWSHQQSNWNSYNSRWDYEESQGQVYGHEFECEQAPQFQQDESDKPVEDMFKDMLSMLRVMNGKLDGLHEALNQQPEQLSQISSTLNEIKESRYGLSAQALDDNNGFDLWSTDQSSDDESVDDRLYTWNSTHEPFEEYVDDTESLLESPMEQKEYDDMSNMGGRDDDKVIESELTYTELDYILEFDNSEIDEDEAFVQEHVDIDSALGTMEVDVMVDADDFDGNAMSNSEIEEYVKCVYPVEIVSITSSVGNFVQQDPYEIGVLHGTQSKQPEKLVATLNLWHGDVLNTSRKGWDLILDDSSLVFNKVSGDLSSTSSYNLKFENFYHPPFKIEHQRYRNEKYMVMQQGKCGEDQRSYLLGFGDSRLEVPDIVTWYKDRGKIGLQSLH